MSDFDLRHLPDEYELPKARFRLIALGVLSLAFICGGAVLASRDLSAGLFVTFFFGIALLVFILILTGGSGVVLQRDKFEVRNLFRSKQYAWRDVSEFTHQRVGRTRMVLFNDTTRSDTGGFRRRFLRGYNSGFTAGLYAGPLDDVVAKMNAFRARALRKP